MKSYKLTKHRVSHSRGAPILMDHELCSGPYDRNARLPHANGSTAREFVMRALLGEPLPDDPSLSCDEGQDLQTYAWLWLTAGTATETLQFAEMYCRLKERGIKLPAIQMGPSLAALRAR